MIEWPLIVMGGALGSAHCAGMCGSFAITIGAATSSWVENLKRQALYNAGRTFTYAILGMGAGYGGWRLGRLASDGVALQAWISIAAGLVLVVQGLASAGFRPGRWGKRRRPRSAAPPCLASSFFAPFLTERGWSAPLVAGVLNGFLPCGLVYGYLTLAGSTGAPWLGGLTMIAFGLGVLPTMLLVGLSGSLVSASLTLRQRLFTIAAWCVVITGVLAIARGIAFLQAHDGAASCPACLS